MPDPVQFDSHAAATLRYIRESMEGASTVAVPGSAGIAMGSVGLFAAAVTSIPALHARWLPIWVGAALLAAVIGGILVVRPSSWQGLARAGTPLRKLGLCMVPALAAGAALTAVHWAAGSLHVIPGTWLLLYGCALVAASVATTRTIGLMGSMFMALGLVALVTPDSAQIPLLGIGFGGLHVVFGFIIGHAGHGREI